MARPRRDGSPPGPRECERTAVATLKRRSFLVRTAQLALGTAGLLAGCGSGTAPPKASPAAVAPTATAPDPPLAPTAVVRAQATAIAESSPARTDTAVPTAPAATARPTGEAAPQLVVATGLGPEAITRAAVNALGGIERFVRPGQRVLIKPNICTSRAPEYAATTNPVVVATLVTLCREAGADRVLVVDNPFSGVNTAYRTSGIEAAVKAVGGDIETMSRLKYRKTEIPLGKDIKVWSIYEDALTYDVLINVPIAKNHNLATLTLGMKNLMGLIDNPGAFHSNIGQRLADLGTVVRPHLILVDAVRILTRNGPTGGNLQDVKTLNTVVATVDPVAADAYAATLFGLEGDDLPYVRAGFETGLGEKDLSKLRIGEITV